MAEFQIIEAKPYYCGQIVRRLRAEHRAAIAGFNVRAHDHLRANFDASTLRRAWLVDGRLAALWGVTGSALASAGYCWMAATAEATRYPIELVKETRRQLEAIMETKREIVTHLMLEDRTALRFATRLGFEIAHGTPVPFAGGYVITVCYKRETLAKAA